MSVQIASVLLVDDDKNTCNIFGIIMGHHQISFEIVHDVKSALVNLKQHNPSIIIVDLSLPEIDGYQALTKFRPLVGDSNCKIVATTAYYSDETEYLTQQAKFDGYLPKPFNPENLLSYLEDVIR